MKKSIFILFLTYTAFSQQKFDFKIQAGFAQMGINAKNAVKMGIYKSNAVSPLIGLGVESNKSKLNYGINLSYLNASFDRTPSLVNKSINMNFHTFNFNPYFSFKAIKKSNVMAGLFSSVNFEDTRKKIIFERTELPAIGKYSILKRQILRNSPIGVSLGYQVQVQNRLNLKIERYQSLFVPKESSLIVNHFGKSFFSSWQIVSSFSLKKK